MWFQHNTRMHLLNAEDTYLTREWCSSVNLCFWRPSEAAFSLSRMSSFCSVTPVTTHPFCEVTIIIFVIVHNDSRQEPERHNGVGRGAGRSTKLRLLLSGAEGKDEAELTWSGSGWQVLGQVGRLLHSVVSQGKGNLLELDPSGASNTVGTVVILGWSKNIFQSACSSL